MTANGSIRSISEIAHSDLFWALRGGGGGTFAVVSSITYELQYKYQLSPIFFY